MNVMRGGVALCVSAICLTVFVGCKTGEPGVTNRLGTIKTTLAASPKAATEAAVEVFKDMGLVVISSASTTIDGRVVAQTAQEVTVWVDVDKFGDSDSKVSIRFGALSDTDLSLTILHEIKAELGLDDVKADGDDTVDDDK